MPLSSLAWRLFKMDPLTMGLITGGANLLGSFFSNSTSASNTQAQIAQQQQMQQSSQDFNAGQAQISRDYSTQMSNTAYQRASADMRSAGLNPMMMFGGGSAASTPSSPTASIGTPTPPVSQSRGALGGLGDAVNKGLDAMVNAKTIDKMSTEIANLKATQGRTEAETLTELKRPDLVATETSAVAARRALTHAEDKNERIRSYILGNEATRAQNEREFRETPFGRRADQAAMGGRALSDVVAPLLSSASVARRYMENRY